MYSVDGRNFTSVALRSLSIVISSGKLRLNRSKFGGNARVTKGSPCKDEVHENIECPKTYRF